MTSLQHYAELSILKTANPAFTNKRRELLTNWLQDISSFQKNYKASSLVFINALLSCTSHKDIHGYYRWQCYFLAAVLANIPIVSSESLLHALCKGSQEELNQERLFILRELAPQFSSTEQAPVMSWIIAKLSEERCFGDNSKPTQADLKLVFLTMASGYNHALLKASGQLKVFRKCLLDVSTEFWNIMAQSPGRLSDLLGERRLQLLLDRLKKELNVTTPKFNWDVQLTRKVLNALQTLLFLSRCLEPKQQATFEITALIADCLQKNHQLVDTIAYVLEPNELALFIPFMKGDGQTDNCPIRCMLLKACSHLGSKLLHVPRGTPPLLAKLVLNELATHLYGNRSLDPLADIAFKVPEWLLSPLSALLRCLSDAKFNALGMIETIEKHIEDKYWRRRRYGIVILRCLVENFSSARLLKLGLLPLIEKSLKNESHTVWLAGVEALISIGTHLSKQQREKLELIPSLIKAIEKDQYDWHISSENTERRKQLIMAFSTDEKASLVKAFIEKFPDPQYKRTPAAVECFLDCFRSLDPAETNTQTLVEQFLTKIKHEEYEVRRHICYTLKDMAPALPPKTLKALYSVIENAVADNHPSVSIAGMQALMVFASQLEPRELIERRTIALITSKLNPSKHDSRFLDSLTRTLCDTFNQLPQESLDVFYPLICYFIKANTSYSENRKLRIKVAECLSYAQWEQLKLDTLSDLEPYWVCNQYEPFLPSMLAEYEKFARKEGTVPHDRSKDVFIKLLSWLESNKASHPIAEKITDILTVLIKRIPEEERNAIRKNWRGDPEGIINILYTLRSSCYYQVRLNVCLCLKKIGGSLGPSERNKSIELLMGILTGDNENDNPAVREAAAEALPVFASSFSDHQLDVLLSLASQGKCAVHDCLRSCLPNLSGTQKMQVLTHMHHIINSDDNDIIRSNALDIATDSIFLQTAYAKRFQKVSNTPQAVLLEVLEGWNVQLRVYLQAKTKTESSQQLPDNLRLI